MTFEFKVPNAVEKYPTSVYLSSSRPFVEDPIRKAVEEYTKDEIMKMLNNVPKYYMPVEFIKIKNVIFNDPATIVFWHDGTKTVVKAQDGDIFDPEKGLAMAISKKAMGNKGNYCNELKKWLPEKTFIDDWKSCNPLCHSKVYAAYQRLANTLHDKKSTKSDFGEAMEEAIGSLGEALDD